MKNLRLAIVSTTFVIAACNVNQEAPLTVVVYPIAKRCTVKPSDQDKEQEVECTQLGTYLRETFKASINRQIDVSLSASDTVSKDDKSVDRIAELIRASGYKDVRTWRFEM